jgi:hypothetical protein
MQATHGPIRRKPPEYRFTGYQIHRRETYPRVGKAEQIDRGKTDEKARGTRGLLQEQGDRVTDSGRSITTSRRIKRMYGEGEEAQCRDNVKGDLSLRRPNHSLHYQPSRWRPQLHEDLEVELSPLILLQPITSALDHGPGAISSVPVVD